MLTIVKGSSAQVTFRGAVLGFYRAEPGEFWTHVCRSDTTCPAQAEPISRVHGFGSADRVLSSKKRFAQWADV